ncbi:hypothetical protein [Pectobacterium phage Nobby_B3]|uniref:Uncharacterized protein n=6 Tax=Phimunavirus nobby TaxID=2733343 RepID=A0A3G8FIT3_9CAUD|nr:hypothetical protein HOU16_gp31 [Pectobacterium phage Nobby]AZF94012.1 hypothetical protein [Pectobacterium phage Astalicious]AZF94724.1 hypothetical protein [Pectobacterium phage Nobby_B1]AZF94777.1 hypothetical protein [Pectobacterium phage Nobby_B2]AZF94852.1 hypothetical protein [Pectobacterium phage Nobby_B3]AZF94906.1 hypothetical protein [Pectobacterium phage Nobby_B4]
MAGTRELSFDDERPTDHITPVLNLVNEGKYTQARTYLLHLAPDKQASIRRTIAVKTNIYL